MKKRLLDRPVKPWVMNGLIALLIVAVIALTYAFPQVRAFIDNISGGTCSTNLTTCLSPVSNAGHLTHQPTNVKAGALQAYYPFDGNTNEDAAPSGAENLTPFSTDSTIGNGTGKSGSGLKFGTSTSTSTNQRLASASSETRLDFGGANLSDFTFAGWANFPSQSDDGAILSKYQADVNSGSQIANTREYVLLCDNQPNCTKMDWEVYSGTGTSAVAQMNWSVNTWHFFVIDFKASTGVITFDVDNSGTPASATLSGTLQSSTDPFWIGNFKESVTSFTPLGGTIDEVGVWNRLLTTSERTAVYNGGSGHNYIGLPTNLKVGLLDYWDLDESGSATVRQDSVVTYPLSATSSTAVTYTAGKFGQAASFNGSSSTISIPSITPNSSESVSFWMKTSTNSGYAFNWGNRWCKIGGVTTHKLNCPVNGTDSGSATSNNAIDDGAWHHVVITSTSGSPGTQTLYIDGVAQTTTASTTLNTSAAVLRIGSDNTPANFFNGQIDDFRIYNMVLTSGDVTTLYNGSAPPSCDQSCVGYWKFDEASGATTAADSSGQGATGTLGGNTAAGSFGVYGNGYNFPGHNYVAINSYNGLNGATTVSGEAWIDLLGLTPASNGEARIFSKGSSNDILFQETTGGALAVSINNGGPVTTSTGVVSANTWQHVAFTASDSSGTWTVKIYVNGVQVTSSTLSAGAITSNNNLYLGRYPASDISYFVGNMDDLRLYNRVLSPSEIYEHYLAGKQN